MAILIQNLPSFTASSNDVSLFLFCIVMSAWHVLINSSAILLKPIDTKNSYFSQIIFHNSTIIDGKYLFEWRDEELYRLLYSGNRH